MSTSDCSMPGAFVIALCTLTISNDRPVKTPDRYFFLTRIGGPFSAKTGQIFRLMSLLHCYHSRLPNPLPSKKCELHLMLATRDSPRSVSTGETPRWKISKAVAPRDTKLDISKGINRP